LFALDIRQLIIKIKPDLDCVGKACPLDNRDITIRLERTYTVGRYCSRAYRLPLNRSVRQLLVTLSQMLYSQFVVAEIFMSKVKNI